MFNYSLNHIADDELLDNTRILVQKEREITLEVLRHLREIERRRLFSSLNYQSLFDYCVKHLKYSEGSAQRRIEAMRALRDLPEIEDKIESGVLSLTNVAKAQVLFRTEKKTGEGYSKTEKLELMIQLENKSTREAERVIAKENPESLSAPAKLRVINDTHSELKMTIDKEFEEKLSKLKGLLAHKIPNGTTQEILNHVMDLAIEKLDPKEKPRNSLKKRIWIKSHSKCEICKSQHALQIDHIHPKAKGGTNEVENLRLLCRNCNQREAINKIGEKVIQHWT